MAEVIDLSEARALREVDNDDRLWEACVLHLQDAMCAQPLNDVALISCVLRALIDVLRIDDHMSHGKAKAMVMLMLATFRED